MKLPEAKDDPTWTRLRDHDLEELWDLARAPHVAASYQARMRLLSEVIEQLAGPAGRVLDVGCAQGTLGLMLAEKGLRVDLLDVRSESIAYARARHERGEVSFYVGLLDQSCPPSNEYDVVVCTEVIEHVPAPAEFLIRLKQKVKPGGALVLTTPNASYLFAHLPSYGAAKQAIVDSNAPNSMDGDAHTYLFTREDLATLIRGVGLRVEAHGFFLPVWLEGHLKIRFLHRWLYSLRNDIVHSDGKLPAGVGRHLCASQYVVARAVSA